MIPLFLRLDALRFRALRADYYEYLADLVEGTQGRKSLRLSLIHI